MKSFREMLLNLCGYEIWPPNHDDPTIKGPRPMIITREQADALRSLAANEHEVAEHGMISDVYRKLTTATDYTE